MLSKLKYIFILFLFFQSSSFALQKIEKNYLFTQFLQNGKHAAFSDIHAWRLNEKKKIYSKINSLSAETKAALIATGDDLLKSEWSVLKVTDYLDYVKTGQLGPYGGPSTKRHEKLSQLIIAELVDGKGKFMPEIVNGLWLTLEESTWVLPEHIHLQKAGDGLPDPNEVVIDLRSGDIAAMVAWTRLLLYDELNNISPILIRRIDYELANRVFNPYLTRDDFRWMGFKKQKVNNWNIWINTNVMLTAILTLEKAEIRNKVIEKCILSADYFLNQYPNDGGIDEGITYWKHAGGRLIEFVELLTDLSGNKLNWSNNELIHKIGSYTYKTHIKNNLFVNFADASAVTIPSPFHVFKYGKMFNDPILKNFSSYLYQLEYPNGNKFSDKSLHYFILNIKTANEITPLLPASPMLKQNWLPHLQVITLRENQGKTEGLFFAAKGGHNDESHNHNDIGNFVLYQNGEPVIIDVGVGNYTKQTFSKDRYKLWYMQSQWHNCPTINGIPQKNGPSFKASNVKFENLEKKQVFSLDIASAYPAEAKVKSWKREFVFAEQKGELILKEEYALDEFIKPFEVYFITPLSVTKTENGSLTISNSNKSLAINYDPLLFDVSVEDKMVGDSKLAKVWGSQVKRIVFKSLSSLKNGAHKFQFVAIK